jgi:hypothetical protein
MEEKQYKIYRLILDGETVYVGQTIQKLYKRKGEHNHRKTFERVKESIIELIEVTNDITREHFWIDYYLNKGCILFNKRKGATGLNYEEYKKSKYWKEYMQEYQKTEKHKEYKKKYREENKEKIKKSMKEYYQKNKLKNKENVDNKI